jgi:putative hydrolase of the HAD superfamily
MSRITSIIFDLDGTLYSSSLLAGEIHRVAVNGLALQLGIAPDEADSRLTGAKAAITARSGCEATLSAACRELGGDIRTLHSYLADNVSPEQFIARDERVVAMLQRLQDKYALYLYTNNNQALATRIMRATGIDGLFAAVFTIEDFWRPKPDRLALAKIFAAIGAEPGECLFVGDRYDVDLRFPEEHGSLVFQTTTVAALLQLEEFCKTV